MPRGPESRIPLADARQAYSEYESGWSVDALARLRWRQWGYASPRSAADALTRVFRELELPMRNPAEARANAKLIHGNARGPMQHPGHPDHHIFLEHRRFLARRQKESA